MWELIRSNKRKSWILFFLMGIVLVGLGYFIGAAIEPRDGWVIGIFGALALWTIMSIVSYFSGSSIIMALSGAKKVTHDIHPQLFNVVEEMKIAANLPAMPAVYIIPEEAPNAFATGRNPKNSAIAVTAGLLSRLNRDELQGVIAHEMSHIMNRDVLYMTFAGILLGSIVLISHVFLRGLFYSGGSSRRFRSSRSDRGGGNAQAIIMVVAILLAILGPIMARLLYFAISRKREFLADASAVRLSRYPEGLASALEKISGAHIELASANKVTAPMYIINPLRKRGAKLSALSSTHPPIQQRIKILRSMAHGVNFLNYNNAYSSIMGKSRGVIPPSSLKDKASIPIRKASVEDRAQTAKKQKRDLGDLVRAVNQYAFLTCICGMKFKIPPDFKKSSISCPRCKRENKVPIGEMTAMAAGLGAVIGDQPGKIGDQLKPEHKSQSSGPMTYKRKEGNSWETFHCRCGNVMQLSPAFSGTRMFCRKCGARIDIEN